MGHLAGAAIINQNDFVIHAGVPGDETEPA
jgi:hypothetical protein